MVRNEDRDRFLCAMFAPPQHREALFSLYAFNLEIARIRETVSEPLIGQMRLQWWRDAIVSINEDKPPHHPVAEALADTIHRYDLNEAHFNRLIDSREPDMTDEQPSDMDALVRYAKETSVPLVLLSFEVLSVKDEKVFSAADDVGIAWALTGLLRAMPVYAAANRFFIPKEICNRHGQDVYGFVSAPASEQLRTFVSDVVDLADRHITSARTMKTDIPKQARAALLPATIADGYLKTFRKAGFDPYKARVERLSPLGMVRLMINGFRGSY